MLYEATGDERFLKAGLLGNRYVRSTVTLNGSPEMRGAVKGSFPISGEYAKFQYPNWACKFLIDSNSLEREVREERAVSSSVPGSEPPAPLIDEVGVCDPTNPFYTSEYVKASGSVGERACLLGLYQGDRLVSGCLGFLSGAFLRHSLVIDRLLFPARRFFGRDCWIFATVPRSGVCRLIPTPHPRERFRSYPVNWSAASVASL